MYRARDTRLGRTVALKLTAGPDSDDPQHRLRLEREARAIAALNHPHICAIHDVGREDGRDYLVMEYLEGETLEQRLERGPLPIAGAVARGHGNRERARRGAPRGHLAPGPEARQRDADPRAA